MRILYGVVGEGMGHATRSRVVLDHLVKAHEVHVVASARAYDYLKEKFEGVHRIWGLTIGYADNGVDATKTVLQNVGGAVGGLPMNIRRYFEIANEFKPNVVISDFESWSYLFGRNHRLPVISIDNMQIINRCRHAAAITDGFESDYQISKALVKAKLPGAHHFLISTFFYPELRKDRTTLRPPLLRPEILAAKSERGEHLLVYQTSTSSTDLPATLQASGRECRIYGFRRDLKEPVREGNLTFMPFSEAGFIEDLRTSRAVIANGGFTLMSESVFLRKPFLSVPVRGQFEQILNARYLEKEGFGKYAEALTSLAVDRFLERLPSYEAALGGYRQDGNRDMLEALDRLLENLPKLPHPFEETFEEDTVF